ncbi:MAG: CRTAC1 family protein [Cyclobacteriaceae bacterium]
MKRLTFIVAIINVGLSCKSNQEPYKLSEMTRMLQSIPDSVDIKSAFFLSKLWLEQNPDPAKFGLEDLRLELQYASHLVGAGATKEGISKYKNIKEKYAYALDEKKQLEVDFLLATALLREGEQTNCFAFHNDESCLVPLNGKGQYFDKFSVVEALGILDKVCHQSLKLQGRVDHRAKWLLNIAYQALGEYPAEVPPDLRIDTMFFQSAYSIEPFEEVAISVGVANVSLAGGAIMDDFTGDGWLDIMTTDMSLTGQMKFFVNNKDGSFLDRTTSAGLDGLVGGLNLVQTDYNNDGFLDVFVTRGAWFEEKNGLLMPNSLLKNNGNQTFTDVTLDAGLYSKFPTQVAIWADVNLDGWLDLFIGNEGNIMGSVPNFKDELYMNNRDGTFSNRAKEAGLSKQLFVKGATWIDYNNDTYPDLALTTTGNTGENILLYENRSKESGHVSFVEVTRDVGIQAYDQGFFAMWSWDYNNDGFEDLFANALGGVFSNRFNSHEFQAVCLKNNGDGTFDDVSATMELEHTEKTMGSNFGDVDNDGFLDIYLGTGSPSFEDIIPNRMFLNDSGKKFTDITMSARVGHLQKGHGVGFGDYDNDGDQDVFIQIGGAYDGDIYQDALFKNPGHGNHFVSFDLIGTKSNKMALETKLCLTVEEEGTERKIYSKVTAGSSFGGNSLRQEIGVGQASIIEKLEVKWTRSGTVQTFHNIETDLFYQITEGKQTLDTLYYE